MAVLTVVPAVIAGVAVGATAADTLGDEWVNTGEEAVIIRNDTVATVLTVTLTMRASPDGATVTSNTFTVAAGASKIVGPFKPGFYNDSNGKAKITYSAVTTIYVTVIKIPR